jgi:competence protein ComEC
MVSFAIFFAFGVWLLQQQAVLPNSNWAWLLVPFALFLSYPRFAARMQPLRPILSVTLACLLGFFYAAWFAQYRLSDRLPEEWQGKNIDIIGVVAELPRQHERGLSFAFDVERVLTPSAHVPSHILLSSYDNRKNERLPLHAGERWQLTVRLKQPHGTANPYTFDFEEWMLERNLRASGYIRNNGNNKLLDRLVARPEYFIEHLREAVRDRFHAILGNAPDTGVLTALAVGDQASITQEQWKVFTRTGVNHLMSISGLHVTMLATLIFAITYAMWRRSARLTLTFPARKAAAIAGLLAAFGYALLSGFSVPAQRTVYMLATVSLALLSSRNVAPSQLLAAALVVVLLLDPWSVMAPGFWLSFGAVGLILYVSANRLGRSPWYAEYLRVQWAITLGLIPLLLALFQQASLVSPIANAFAIPLVSFVVVPLTLLGALLPFNGLLWLAHQAMSLCLAALTWLADLPEAVWVQHAPPFWSVVLGMAGVLWCLLPRGFPSRWLGVIFMLPMFIVMPPMPQQNALRMTVFDVGQGLSVVVQTQHHVLLYDTGPDYPGEADSGNRILLPSLRGMGITRLDGLILTHNDMDHIGGAQSVLQAMPTGWVSSSLPESHPLLQLAPDSLHCFDGQHWEWDGVNFEVLHPSSTSYTDNRLSDNNRGCVLRVSTGRNSILLAADIEQDSERRLLHKHQDKLPATLLVVPHHGSTTSSTPEFVRTIHPQYAVFTVGYRNRFGHPKKEIMERYRAMHSELLRSDEDGAIQVQMNANNLSVACYRKTHARYWWQ